MLSLVEPYFEWNFALLGIVLCSMVIPLKLINPRPNTSLYLLPPRVLYRFYILNIYQVISLYHLIIININTLRKYPSYNFSTTASLEFRHTKRSQSHAFKLKIKIGGLSLVCSTGAF